MSELLGATRSGATAFGTVLRSMRQAAGLSQGALAERAGLSEKAVGALERGERTSPRPATVVLLAQAVGATPAERDRLLAAAHAETWVRDPAPQATSSRAGRVQLPVPPTPLIGREAEVAAAGALLDPARSAVRLLTLTGPGGVGKTRLAVATAAELIAAYPDGVVFVDLAPLRDARLVQATIARVLGLPEGRGHSAHELLLAQLGKRRMLLVLDNFEHLLGAAPQLAELLEHCPWLGLLVTSRAGLRLRAERRFLVPPLATPADQPVADEQTIVEAMLASPAVRLFVERAQAAAPNFALDAGTALAVAAICRQLDGMPLAIELAAARAGLLGPETLLRRLERRLAMLTGGAADLPERQQTLRQTLAWSHDLLGPIGQTLFRRLAVFVGGCTLEAAEAVCVDPALPAEELLNRLQVLVDSSLVRRMDQTGEERRYGMLETVREYAMEQLVSSGELERIRNSHAMFYSRLAEPPATAQSPWPWVWAQSPETFHRVFELVEAELDNFNAALDWWSIRSRLAEGLRLAVALNTLWSRLGQYAAGRRGLETMLELADRTAPPSALRAERAVALTEAGTLAGFQLDYEQARRFHRRSAELWRELEHAPNLSIALTNLGLAEWLSGDSEQATALLEDALGRSRAAHLPHTVAICLRDLGLIARAEGKYARAEALFTEAAAQELPPGWYRGYSLARSLSCLGRVAYLRHDLPRARALLQQSFETIRQAGVTGQALADGLDWQAALEAQQGDPGRAVRLFGAADSHWRTSGAHRYAPDEEGYQLDLACARAAVDERTFATGWAEGAALRPEQALAYALRETSPTIVGHGHERIARRDPVRDECVRGGAAVDASGSGAVAGGARGTGGPQRKGRGRAGAR